MRIHIIGCSGTGKSTLAKRLSEELKIPHHDLDDIRFERKYDLARPREERVEMVRRIAKRKEWVVEGTYASSWCYEAARAADVVVELKENRAILIARVWKRFLRRKMSGSRHNETVKSVIELSQYIWRYYSPRSHYGKELQEFFKQVRGELVVLHSFREQEEFTRQISSSRNT